MTEFKHVKIEIDEENKHAVITLSRDGRGAKLNALNKELITELNAALDVIIQNESVRALIITGEGRAFAAGADISQFQGASVIDAEKIVMGLQEVNNKIEDLPIPVIAAVNGFALGGGCELALACDLRIAAESAKLGQPEIDLGIIPGAGGTQRLPRLVGPSRAKELIFTGRHVTAQEALSIGLVDKVVPDSELMDEAYKLAKILAAKAPTAMRYAKMAVNKGLQMNIKDALQFEVALFAMCFDTEDQKRLVEEFLSKRK